MAITARKFIDDADRLGTAQCAIMVRDNPGGPEAYKDGDVVDVWTRFDIARTWAEALCNPRNAGFNADGLRAVTSLTHRYLMIAMKYRCRRTGTDTYERRNIATDEIEVFARGDLGDIIARKRKHSGHMIFGQYGREIWFAERIELTPLRVRAAWTAIQNNSAHREINYRLAPTGTEGIRQFGWVSLDDVTREDAAALLEPEYGEEPDGRGGTQQRIVRRRKNKVPWRDLPSADSDINVATWDDPRFESDARDIARFDRPNLFVPRT